MNKPFRDLKIAGIRKEDCFVVKGPVVRIYLRLDGNPPLGWSYTFSTVWHAASYAEKAPAGADGDSIWVDCVPSDLKPVHFAELENAVAATNVRFREWQQQKEAAQARLEGLDSETKSQIDVVGRSFDPIPRTVVVEKGRSRIAMWLSVFCIYWVITGLVALLWFAGRGGRTGTQAPVILGWLIVLLACALAAYADYRRGVRAKGKRNQAGNTRVAETTP